MEYVNRLAVKGLRTLVFGHRQISSNQYNDLLQQYNQALGMIGMERKIQLNLIRQKIESDLDLIGVTGIEDKLQDGVKETLKKLDQAGIKVDILVCLILNLNL